MKKIKLLIVGIVISLALIGCGDKNTTRNEVGSIEQRLCETGKTCLYLINSNGETFKSFKDPKVSGSQGDVIIFEDSRGRTHYYSGSHYIIYKD